MDADKEPAGLTPAELQHALSELGWSQADLSRNAGIDKNTPTRWLQGQTRIPLWASKYVGLLLEIRRLHRKYLDNGTKSARGAP